MPTDDTAAPEIDADMTGDRMNATDRVDMAQSSLGRILAECTVGPAVVKTSAGAHVVRMRA